MMRAALLAAALLSAAPAAAELAVPSLTGPVVDTAGLLDAQWTDQLSRLSRAARQQEGGQGVQLQYLIVPSLQGEAIEDYSIRVAEAWKIGSKGRDNGVLITVAVEDRAVRIEVGGGLEGGLTDLQSSRIIRQTIAPAFQRQQFGPGLYDAGRQVLGALGALPEGVAPATRTRPTGRQSIGGLFWVLLFILFFVSRIFSGFGPRRRSFWFGGPFGGFGGGRGGGFGGGWGGGGGGFSGGGASGRW